MVAGKYEIDTTSAIFTIDSVELSDNEYVSLVEENGKYYVIIEETPNDAYGMITINLVKKDHEGYQSEPNGTESTDNTLYMLNNYWKTSMSETSTNSKTKSRMSRKLVVPEPEEDSFITETSITEKSEILDDSDESNEIKEETEVEITPQIDDDLETLDIDENSTGL
jgi:hypothetical protein